MSIFKLITSKEDLSSVNEGMSNAYYDEVLPMRSIVDNDYNSTVFQSGPISFRFDYGTSWWLPKRSYFVIEVELSRPNGDVLRLADDVAVGMNPCACLFSKCQFKINDKTISEVSNHLPQIQNIKTRLEKSGHWLLTTGDNLAFWESKFEKRLNQVCGDGIAQDTGPLDRFLSPIEANQHRGEQLEGIMQLNQNQVQFFAAVVGPAAADGYALFTPNGGAAIPDLRTIFYVGDTVHINDGAEKIKTITLVTADRLYFDGVVTAQAAANLVGQVRVPRPMFSSGLRSARRVKKFVLLWQPPLSIWDIDHALPACGKFDIDFTPYDKTNYPKYFIESLHADKSQTTDGLNATANTFKLLVKSMKLKNLRVDGPIVEKESFYLDLEEIRAQSNIITSSSLSQYNLTVSPATYGLTVAFQDASAGSDTRYSLSKLKVRNSEELRLTNFYLRYGGIQKPIPNDRPIFSAADNTDTLVELYGRNTYYDGSEFKPSSEMLDEFRERGMYIHFPFPRDGTLKDTRVYISTEFSGTFTANPRLMLFDHFKKVVQMRIENGTLMEIIVNEV